MSNNFRWSQMLALVMAGTALAQDPQSTSVSEPETDLQECLEGISRWGSGGEMQSPYKEKLS